MADIVNSGSARSISRKISLSVILLALTVGIIFILSSGYLPDDATKDVLIAIGISLVASSIFGMLYEGFFSGRIIGDISARMYDQALRESSHLIIGVDNIYAEVTKMLMKCSSTSGSMYVFAEGADPKDSFCGPAINILMLQYETALKKGVKIKRIDICKNIKLWDEFIDELKRKYPENFDVKFADIEHAIPQFGVTTEGDVLIAPFETELEKKAVAFYTRNERVYSVFRGLFIEEFNRARASR